MIIMDATEAEKVRGSSPKDAGRVLVPMPLLDGRFMLGEEVLDDPAHEDVRQFLAALPREELSKLPAIEISLVEVKVQAMRGIALGEKVDRLPTSDALAEVAVSNEKGAITKDGQPL